MALFSHLCKLMSGSMNFISQNKVRIETEIHSNEQISHQSTFYCVNISKTCSPNEFDLSNLLNHWCSDV